MNFKFARIFHLNEKNLIFCNNDYFAYIVSSLPKGPPSREKGLCPSISQRGELSSGLPFLYTTGHKGRASLSSHVYLNSKEGLTNV